MKTETIKYLALLRGINVGGKNLIKMDELRRLFETVEFENVRTYIQSGNVLFESTEMNDKIIAAKLEAALKKHLGEVIPVFIRTADELGAIAKLNPFKKITTASSTKLYVSFLNDELKKKPELPHISPKNDVEIIEIRKREVYSLTKEIKGRSGFPNNFVEKEYAIPATTRNWSTVCKLFELTTSES
ncbi:MAG: hypothetical protein CVV24_02125 [Ignavibacteriae bacterium HGW-Ignavibacteriae-3]|nr:MAG: hypothetical protein CVV24_02125 [Ignavibacteriae bacterium HGW-Ignavibacteriae-3]